MTNYFADNNLANFVRFALGENKKGKGKYYSTSFI